VQAEEDDAGVPVEGGVGAQVDLGEGGQAGQRRPAAQVDVAQLEGDHAEPGVAGEGVGLERGGQQRADVGGVDRPVGEEEVAPGLGHDP
jgi:hypothetical protein